MNVRPAWIVFSLCWILAASPGCNTTETADPDTASPAGDTAVGQDAAAGADTASQTDTIGGGADTNTAGQDTANPGERTLESCSTTIAADVPDFYKTYFRCVDISMNGGNVVITTKNLPPHRSNYFATGDPNEVPFDTSRGAGYVENPNTLSEKNLSIELPPAPTARGLTISDTLVDGVVGTSNDEYGLGPQGIALDSVALFNPLAAPGDDIEDEKFTFDLYNGHPTNDGTYHYHTTSPGPLEVVTAAGGAGEVYGIMCDGTLILGCTELDGSAPSSADFDAQNGHVHDISDATTTHFTGRYHTHMCPDTFTAHKFTPEVQYYDGSCPSGGPP